MCYVERRLAEIGIKLDEYEEPHSLYVPAVVAGNLVFMSGQLSATKRGEIVTGITGRLCSDNDLERGREASRIGAIGLLERARAVIGGLDRVTRIVRLVGYINAGPDFGSHHLVMDSCSEIFMHAFGNSGTHARPIAPRSLIMGDKMSSKKILNNRQAAARLGITPSTLDRMRSRGTSPAFFKTGRRVNYLEEAIEQYIAKNSFGSTSEYPKGWKFPGRRPPSDEPDDPVYA